MQTHNGLSKVLSRSFAAFALVGLGCAYAQDGGRAFEGFSGVQLLQIVDCLLPGQVRVVGGRIYPTPRRPTRTTAEDCAARGGEFLAYDRADYRSALNVWLSTAEGGDAEAQTLVGEIYERGLGSEPNYEAAVEWYRRAAEQGYSRAQYNLGVMYEQGLGVPQDSLEALNWYRRSSNLSEDSLIFKSAAATQQAELEQQIGERETEIDSLRQRIAALDEQLRERDDAAAELDTLREALVLLEAERESDQRRLATFRNVDDAVTTRVVSSFMEPEERRYRRRTFGRFYALVIGVQGYASLDDLASPGNDVERAARVLEQKYGFSVRTLIDPDQTEVMRAVNELNDQLSDNDNLLIYFAGHGSRLQGGVRETGYWLPANADPPPDNTYWVSNDFVTDHLARLQAKRVLVVADSCYAGLLGDDPGYVMVGESSYSDDYIEWKMPRRSRLVLASGGDRPVLDSDGGGHSVFARALLEELENNEQVLTAPELFLRVRERVRQSPLASEIGQDPQLKVIKNAGNEVGDFFFVPG
jgi:uncharacterized protein